jgi:peptide/nickel transport system permease protein
MLAYTIRRLLAAIPILIAATFIVFWLVSLTVDPVTEEFAGLNPPPPQQTIDLERHRLGLDKGFFAQYFDWLRNLVTHGTFGPALNPATDINSELYHRLGVTMRLIVAAMVVALVLAVITGVLSAYRQYTRFDYTATFFGFLFLAMPTFWIAQLLKTGAITFNDAIGTRLFFTIGEKSDIPPNGFWDQFLDVVGHMILPTLSLALITYAAWSRFQRAAMLDVLNSDYIRLARAKGLKPRQVLVKHALRTALIPMTTASALTIATIIGGAVITETVFQWQGMGKFLVQSVLSHDRNATMAWLVVAGTFVIVGNLIADLLYAVLDPRIRYG